MQFIKIPIILMFVMLSGCGSSDESSEYAGNWYEGSSDKYYQVAENENVNIYSCTIHDGYQLDTDLNIEIEGNNFIYQNGGYSDTGTLQRTGNTLTFNFDVAAMQLTQVEEIPSVCVNNAIEIQIITPLEVKEGEYTNFSITADYRLASQDSIIIEVGYSDTSESFRLADEMHEVTEKGIGTVSFNFNVTPKIFEDGNSFNIHVVAYDELDAEDGSFVIKFSDELPLIFLDVDNVTSGSLG
jgi:hypothetical protein